MPDPAQPQPSQSLPDLSAPMLSTPDVSAPDLSLDYPVLLPGLASTGQQQAPASLIPTAGPRQLFIGFVKDPENQAVLHTALAGHIPNHNQIYQAGFRQALATLAGIATPEIVLVDISGEDQPINALKDLAEVVDEGTIVLAVGEAMSVSFYRIATKDMGVREYLPKPLTQSAIIEYFLPQIGRQGRTGAEPRGGRLVALCGARGGVGTSSIAANLAWYIAREMHRHTVLMDGEINTGTLALNMNIPNNRGLPAVLQAPDRVDQLLIERCIYDLGDRLHVMAGLEELDWETPCAKEGFATLLQGIRTRYNFTIADAGARLSALGRQLLFNATQRVVVLDPTLISMRNLARLQTLPGGSTQALKPLLVLNREGAPGGLSRRFIEDKLETKLDAVIPDLPRIVGTASGLGTLPVQRRGAFRNGIAALAQALGATAPATSATQPSLAAAMRKMVSAH